MPVRTERPKTKACLLVNMIVPARLTLYSALADHFNLLVLHGGMEEDRETWRDTEKRLTNAQVKRAWGFQISTKRKENGRLLDRRYIHFTPGFIWELLRFRPEVLISNEMGFRTLVALAYGTLFRKPVWVWWGGTPHTERNIGVARRAVRAAISRWARRWISYGQTSTEYLLSLGIGRGAIVEVQNAVDERRFAGHSSEHAAGGDETTDLIRLRPVLLCVGSLIARKGIEPLFHAAASLQREGRKFSLLLVGGGRDGPMLERLAKDLGLENVHFQRARPPEKMASVYRSGDILVFPTLEDVWGLVANEAVLSGIPVLCSKYAGCAGELFPPQNIFDPLDPLEFKGKLRSALAGEIARPDASRLKTTAALAGELVRALEGCLRDPDGLVASGGRAHVVQTNAR